jgi:hypothetical protein
MISNIFSGVEQAKPVGELDLITNGKKKQLNHDTIEYYK